MISVAGQLLGPDCNLKLAKAWEDATASVHGLSPHYNALMLGGRHEPRSLDIDAVNVHRIALALRQLSHTDLPALGGILAALTVLLISEKNLEACKKNELLELLAARRPCLEANEAATGCRLGWRSFTTQSGTSTRLPAFGSNSLHRCESELRPSNAR